MSISERQSELDVKKWLESENVGHDLCGEFDFCKKCDKNLENPCATAYDVFNAPKKRTVKKSTAKKSASTEVAATAPTPKKRTTKRA